MAAGKPRKKKQIGAGAEGAKVRPKLGDLPVKGDPKGGISAGEHHLGLVHHLD